MPNTNDYALVVGVNDYRALDALDGAKNDALAFVGWLRDPAGRGWPILFQTVPEGKTVKNRLHLDLSPPSTMQAEVDRLVAAGANALRLVDEGGSFWTVLADPEGNEFCVLRGPDDDPPRERPS